MHYLYLHYFMYYLNVLILQTRLIKLSIPHTLGEVCRVGIL